MVVKVSSKIVHLVFGSVLGGLMLECFQQTGMALLAVLGASICWAVAWVWVFFGVQLAGILHRQGMRLRSSRWLAGLFILLPFLGLLLDYGRDYLNR